MNTETYKMLWCAINITTAEPEPEQTLFEKIFDRMTKDNA